MNRLPKRSHPEPDEFRSAGGHQRVLVIAGVVAILVVVVVLHLTGVVGPGSH